MLRARLLVALLAVAGGSSVASAQQVPPLVEVRVKSSVDGTAQPSLIWGPQAALVKPTPMLVFLHSWSGDYRQKNRTWQFEAYRRGWIFLHPNFRGRNDNPAACGSLKARRDVLDAIDYAIAHYKVDTTRIYLAGSSGGGHMTLLMSAYYPERFSAASAWVGISNLAEWYRFHTRNGKRGRYAEMTARSCGGAPGASPKIDAEYKARSPIYHLHRVGDLPIDIAAGVKDGKTGSVPIMHSLNAFNAIAKAGKHKPVSPREIEELWKRGRLSNPQPGDTGVDSTYGRTIFLRRKAGPARITIFDGGHEGIAKAGVAWLARQRRATKRPRFGKAGAR